MKKFLKTRITYDSFNESPTNIEIDSPSPSDVDIDSTKVNRTTPPPSQSSSSSQQQNLQPSHSEKNNSECGADKETIILDEEDDEPSFDDKDKIKLEEHKADVKDEVIATEEVQLIKSEVELPGILKETVIAETKTSDDDVESKSQIIKTEINTCIDISDDGDDVNEDKGNITTTVNKINDTTEVRKTEEVIFDPPECKASTNGKQTPEPKHQIQTKEDLKAAEKDPSEETPPLCRDFARGHCLRADCRFRHLLHLSDLNNIYTFCYDYQNKGCERPSCRFVHADFTEQAAFFRTGVLPHAIRHRTDICGVKFSSLFPPHPPRPQPQSLLPPPPPPPPLPAPPSPPLLSPPPTDVAELKEEKTDVKMSEPPPPRPHIPIPTGPRFIPRKQETKGTFNSAPDSSLLQPQSNPPPKHHPGHRDNNRFAQNPQGCKPNQNRPNASMPQPNASHYAQSNAPPNQREMNQFTKTPVYEPHAQAQPSLAAYSAAPAAGAPHQPNFASPAQREMNRYNMFNQGFMAPLQTQPMNVPYMPGPGASMPQLQPDQRQMDMYAHSAYGYMPQAQGQQTGGAYQTPADAMSQQMQHSYYAGPHQRDANRFGPNQPCMQQQQEQPMNGSYNPGPGAAMPQMQPPRYAAPSMPVQIDMNRFIQNPVYMNQLQEQPVNGSYNPGAATGGPSLQPPRYPAAGMPGGMPAGMQNGGGMPQQDAQAMGGIARTQAAHYTSAAPPNTFGPSQTDMPQPFGPNSVSQQNSPKSGNKRTWNQTFGEKSARARLQENGSERWDTALVKMDEFMKTAKPELRLNEMHKFIMKTVLIGCFALTKEEDPHLNSECLTHLDELLESWTEKADPIKKEAND